MWCRVVDEWGTTAEERAAPSPGDGLIAAPDRVLFRGITIAAPSPLVFRWLCQLRVAPYSYDWIDNFGRRSPRHLIDGLDHLEVGQRVARIFRLVAFDDGRSITLDSTTPVFGRVVIDYRVDPLGDDRSRLVAKLTLDPPQGVRRPLLRFVLPPGDLVMMHKQFRTLRALAERDARAAAVTR